MARTILSIMGKDESHIDYVLDRKGHDFRYAIDFSKIFGELGWSPKHQLMEGLSKTIDWYTNNYDWWKPLKDRIINDVTNLQK